MTIFMFSAYKYGRPAVGLVSSYFPKTPFYFYYRNPSPLTKQNPLHLISYQPYSKKRGIEVNFNDPDLFGSKVKEILHMFAKENPSLLNPSVRKFSCFSNYHAPTVLKPFPPFSLLTPCILVSRHFSTKSVAETKFTPIKVVSNLDLCDISLEIFQKSLLKIERRFPLVYRNREDGMRRTVSPVVDKHFALNRNFLFISVCFSNVSQDLQLLVSTITTKLVGLKGQGKLILFGDVSLCGDVTGVSDVDVAGVSDIIHLNDFHIPEEASSLIICNDQFEDAVKQLNIFLQSVASGLVSGLDSGRIKYYADCLAMLYAFTFRGVVFRNMKSFLVAGFENEDFSANVSPPAVLELNKHWEQISASWYRGQFQWNGISIGDALGVVKYSPPLEEVKISKWMDPRPKEQEQARKDFEDRLKCLVRGTSRLAAREAWEAARLGYDEAEYFEEAKFFDEDSEAEARRAWKESAKNYY